MAWFWQGKKTEGPAVSADFRHALTQEVLRTELIRIKALIGTTVLLASLIVIIHFVDPMAVQHLWHGRLNPVDLFKILIPFVLYEVWVHSVITRHLGKDRDLPVVALFDEDLVVAGTVVDRLVAGAERDEEPVVTGPQCAQHPLDDDSREEQALLETIDLVRAAPAV